LNFEQVLFLDIFELPHKFGSNLGFKTNGNSVNLVNSNRGSHLTASDLLLGSRCSRGQFRRRAGVEKLLGAISVCLDRVIKAGTPSPSLFLLPLLFLTSLIISVEPAPSP